MTQKEFEQLPVLLRRWDVLAVGIVGKDIRYLVETGVLDVCRLKPNGRRYYTKDSVARLLNRIRRNP